jgi:hypothetical protein
MTTPLFDRLAGLPEPWCLTHGSQRRRQAAQLPSDPHTIAGVLAVLERCLQALGDVSAPTDDCVPESLLPYWAFTAEWLAEEMPTLDSVSTETTARLLETRQLDAPGTAEALARYFAYWAAEDVVDSILAWLRSAGELSPAHRHRLVELTSRFWISVPVALAAALFRTAADVAGAEAQPVLDAVAGDPAASQAVKNAAANYRTWIAPPP